MTTDTQVGDQWGAERSLLSRTGDAFAWLIRSTVPATWPRPMRRLFVIALPVSVPIWAAWCAVVMALVIAATVAAFVAIAIASAVCGLIVLPVVWVIAQCEELWSPSFHD